MPGVVDWFGLRMGIEANYGRKQLFNRGAEKFMLNFRQNINLEQ